MVISSTPYRISFFGGGTDFPLYYENINEGSVISTTINKYCYISLRKLPKFFSHNYRITYSKVELVNSISEISHPVVRHGLEYIKCTDGLEIHHDGDVPAWSGLGTSSSFTVGLLLSLKTLMNDKNSKKSLALDAIYVEQKLLKERVGSQDQVAVAYGGFNKITFFSNKNFSVQKIQILENQKQALEESILLIYTGIKRKSDDIEKDKIINLDKKLPHLRQIEKIRDEALEIFEGNNFSLETIGKLMTESWLEKKGLSSKVSNELIDDIINVANSNGAYGAKVLGAGGGGFVLVIAEPALHKTITTKLNGMIIFNLKFENEGSKIIFNNKELNK